MFNPGLQELLLVLTIALIVVGPGRLPEVARFLGRSSAKAKRARDSFHRLAAGIGDQLSQETPHRADAIVKPNPLDAPGQYDETTKNPPSKSLSAEQNKTSESAKEVPDNKTD